MSTTPAPITSWIEQAKLGDPSAYEYLWKQYFASVVRLARGRMFALKGTFYDEEDAALSAMHSLFVGIDEGRFPELNDRLNLWQILVKITHRKLRAQWRRETADKRSATLELDSISMNEIVCDEPRADFVAEMMDETASRIAVLGDKRLQRIALLRLEGFTFDEIAEQLGCATRTINRKVQRIREIWHHDSSE